MWEKHKEKIIIAAILIIAVLIIYFMGKRRGKVTAEGPSVNYPKGGNAIPLGWDPKPLAKELHQVMDGLFTLSGTKDTTFKKLLSLPTDDMFVAVYSVYNQLYFSAGDGTLREWINAEKYTDLTSTTVESLNERFDKLNLA